MPKLCWSMGLVGLARGLLLSNWPSRLFRVITSSTLMASQLITLIHWRAYPAPGDLSLSLIFLISNSRAAYLTANWLGGMCRGKGKGRGGKICLNFSPRQKPDSQIITDIN